MKTCPRCKKSFPSDFFNWKIKDKKRSVYCKDCSRAYCRTHYTNNKEEYLKKAKIWKKEYKSEIQKFLFEFLSSHPCVDCGEKNIIVLEFDHIDPSEKEFTISKAVRNQMDLKKIQKEIQKCDIRCANCHKIKTAKDFGWWKSSSSTTG